MQERNWLEKTLNAIAGFLEDRIDSRILIWAFIWYIPAIPFQIIATLLNEAFGYGRRKRKENRNSVKKEKKEIFLLKEIASMSSGMDHFKVLDYCDIHEIKHPHDLLDTYIRRDILQYDKDTNSYTHKGVPESYYSNYKKCLRKIYDKHNNSLDYIQPKRPKYKIIACPNCGNTTSALWLLYCDTCDTYLGKENDAQVSRWRENNKKEREATDQRLYNWEEGIGVIKTGEWERKYKDE